MHLCEPPLKIYTKVVGQYALYYCFSLDRSLPVSIEDQLCLHRRFTTKEIHAVGVSLANAISIPVLLFTLAEIPVNGAFCVDQAISFPVEVISSARLGICRRVSSLGFMRWPIMSPCCIDRPVANPPQTTLTRAYSMQPVKRCQMSNAETYFLNH